MKPKMLVAAMALLAAQTANAGMMKMQLSNFNFPIYDENQEIVGSGKGGSLELIIDDAILDANADANAGHFIDAIVGGHCKEGLNDLQFDLDLNATTEIFTKVTNFSKINFVGKVKNGTNTLDFSLQLEGNFPSSVGGSLENINYAEKNWLDSVNFELHGEGINFIGATPVHFSVEKYEPPKDVPEPSGALLLMAGLLGLCYSRKKWRPAI